MRCIGRLPWKDLGAPVNAVVKGDSTGSEPWYAISANLTDPNCVTLLNPAISALPTTLNSCARPDTLPHPWLTVQNAAGVVLSNRVAAVIILPGPPLATLGQVRASNPAAVNRALIGTYLEGVNASLTDTFQQSPATATFNDQLAFITIDELIAATTQRVGNEVRALLNKKLVSLGYFPWAAPLSYQNGTNTLDSQAALEAGFLPTPLCTITDKSNYSYDCPLRRSVTPNTFDPTENVAQFAINTGAGFTSTTGACQISGAGNRTCACSGAGQCSNAAGTRLFDCDANGACSSSFGIIGNFSFTLRSGSTPFTSASPNCTLTTSTSISCPQPNPSAGVTRTASIAPANALLGGLPDWFYANGWRHYLFYTLASNCNPTTSACNGASPTGWLNEGNTPQRRALVISTGPALGSTNCNGLPRSQGGSPATPFGLRPSNNVCDYLDSLQNTNGDKTFDPHNTPSSNSYNDKTFVIAP